MDDRQQSVGDYDHWLGFLRIDFPPPLYVQYSMYAHMMMTAADSPIPADSGAITDRRVILTDRRRYATCVIHIV